MALNYGFDINDFGAALLDELRADAANAVDQLEANARIAKIEVEMLDEFNDFAEKQVYLLALNIKEQIPKRSGNLADSVDVTNVGGDDAKIFTTARTRNGRDLGELVLEGRGAVKPVTGNFLKFKDSRVGWRPANPQFVSGSNYPNLSNIRSRWRLGKVGPAPAVRFDVAGVDAYQRKDLAAEAEVLRLRMAVIIERNGGTVTSTS